MQRRLRPEWMDAPEVAEADYQQAMADLAWANARFGNTRALLKELTAGLQAKGGQQVLELGCGGGEFLTRLADWGRANQVNLQLVGLDSHPLALKRAQAVTQTYPEICIQQGNALDSGLPAQSMDWVVSALMLHHLDDPGPLFAECQRLARKGFVILDLERSRWAWLSLKILGRFRGKLFAHDGPVSVGRALSYREALAVAPPGVRVKRLWPFRLLWVG
jgi:ubiquinone/menaquinone biosynthesis C-methylase UbiE